MDPWLLFANLTVASSVMAGAIIRNARRCIQSERPPDWGVVVVSTVIGISVVGTPPLLFAAETLLHNRDVMVLGVIAWGLGAVAVVILSGAMYEAWVGLVNMAMVGEASIDRLSDHRRDDKSHEFSLEDMDRIGNKMTSWVDKTLEETPDLMERTDAGLPITSGE